MWVIRTTKRDVLNLGWIIPWSLLLFIGITGLEIILFFLGLVFGYATDFAGVISHKWWYPHYENRLYSLSAGYGWGIATLLTYRINLILFDQKNELTTWVIIGVLILSWLLMERKRGLTTLTNRWMVLRTFLTLLLFLVSNDLIFLIVAGAIAIYIEGLGTYLRIWIYYDKAPSYLFLGSGYAQLSYFCYLITITFMQIYPTPIQIFLTILIIALYILDYWTAFNNKTEALMKPLSIENIEMG